MSSPTIFVQITSRAEATEKKKKVHKKKRRRTLVTFFRFFDEKCPEQRTSWDPAMGGLHRTPSFFSLPLKSSPPNSLNPNSLASVWFPHSCNVITPNSRF